MSNILPNLMTNPSASESPASALPTKDLLMSIAIAPPGATATTSSGLDLLFAASQVETKSTERERADVKADSTEAEVKGEVPSTITVVTNGTGTTGAESESASSSGSDEEETSSEYDGKKPTIDGALKDQKVKTFPQVLQEILNTPEYESIAHWLPDGHSFIIADKRRFSNVILPKYFHRVALFHSFIRKLNRYGFRRVKGSCKGEESSFAHNNFVRDKPWLCLKMSCKSKPSYSYARKVPSVMKTQQTAANSTNIATAGLTAMPTPLPSNFVGVGGMMDAGSSLFASTPMSYLPTASSISVLPMTSTNIGSPTTTATIAAAAAANEERQLVALLLSDHYSQQKQQRVLRERQMHMLQMRRRQVQLQLQRLQEMSAYDEGHTPSCYDSHVQSLMAQSHDMLRRSFFH